MATYLSPGHMFPNLREMSWDPPEDSLFPYIHRFLGPNIVDVRLSFSLYTSNISLLPQLALPYPTLKSLIIDTYVEDSYILLRTASKTAFLLQHIENLVLNKLDRDALEYLSQLPKLETLILDTPHLHNSDPRSHSTTGMRSGESPFPALRALKFFNTTIEFALEFLDLWPISCLHDFGVGTEVAATEFTIGRIYAVLARQLSHTALKSLNISLPDERGMQAPPASTIADYVVGGYEIAPLFCFGNLTEVPVGFDIDDTTASDMASAWPNLTAFSLCSASGLHHPSSMTLYGLRAFAKYCKDLQTLDITVDATTIPPFDNSPEAKISQSSLLYSSMSARLPSSTHPPSLDSCLAYFPPYVRSRL
ncbi:hypothetical protein B0H11DRAFT_546308 [Mycena galericulata]|nr:hypothetical protein B0H11DRAFT_546308 [Mycena galericulata]